MVVAAIIIGFVVLTTMVVPRFANIYGQFAVKLPLPTRILLGLNYALTHYWWAIIGLVIMGSVVLQRLIHSRKGRIWWDGFKLKVPVFGPLVLKLVMARFTRLTGSLMKSGVGLFEILSLVREGVGNAQVSRTIESLIKSISEGKGLSEPMRASRMFSPIVVQMVSVGEQSGKLDELLLSASDYYDAQVKYTVENLTSLIEPILIFVLGCAVLFMALGIFLPMWDLMSLFRR